MRHDIVWEDIRNYIKRTDIGWKKLAGKKVLLTGANGFLTSYMADTAAVLNDEILPEPCHFIAVTRRPVEPSHRIGHLLDRKDFTFIAEDVSKGLEIPEGVDYLIHGASPASPKVYLEKRVETMDTNVNGMRSILDYSLENPVSSILFISSSTVYGNPPPDKIPTSEDFGGDVLCTSDRACYSEAKRYCETLCHQFYKAHGTPVKAVRPFHNYGPGLRLDDGRAIADFLADALAGRPIEIRSAGTTRITYCYVADAAEAFWRILLSDANGEAFNMGSDGPEYSIKEVAEHISKQFDPPTEIQIKPQEKKSFQKGSAKRTCADISKIRDMLDWKPVTSFDEGLKRSIEWYKAQ